MKYKVVLGGRGADLYVHRINEEQKNKLKVMDVENHAVPVDWDKIPEVLDKVMWDETDEVYSGIYPSPDLYYISVFDENEELVWESNNDFFIDQGEEDDDYKFIDEVDVLLIEHSFKGSLKEYNLEIEGEFNPEKLTYKSLDYNEEVEIITDLKYDNKEMEVEEWGDNWSKGTFLYIF